jgi:hypothetical protein
LLELEKISFPFKKLYPKMSIVIAIAVNAPILVSFEIFIDDNKYEIRILRCKNRKGKQLQINFTLTFHISISYLLHGDTDSTSFL